jgi:predicted hydrocarbon binding protein
MARQTMGRRVRVAEVACVAAGDAHCVYAFYKS